MVAMNIQIKVDSEYLELLEKVAEEARVVERVLISYLTEEADTLNLTSLMEVLGKLSEYEESKRGLPQ